MPPRARSEPPRPFHRLCGNPGNTGEFDVDRFGPSIVPDVVPGDRRARLFRESAIERMVRDARVQSIGGGATEVMLEEIAKRFGAALSD